MRVLSPVTDVTSTELSDDDLRELYRFPDGRRTVRVNFVTSLDGAHSVDGTSRGLGSPADHRVYHLLRELSDAVLVGAGTVRTENYGGAKIPEHVQDLREQNGQDRVPPVVVVSARALLDPNARLFTDTDRAPIVAVAAIAPPESVQKLRDAGAEVLVLGGSTVDLPALLAELEQRGITRILCEGGPGLFGTLIDENLVDELCLTVSPVLVAGNSGRISASPRLASIKLTPATVLVDEDGTVLTRWVRAQATS